MQSLSEIQKGPLLTSLALLIAMTIAVYAQTRDFQLLNFDDPLYVTDNSRVQEGLTLDTIRWAFTGATQYTNYWAPLTWLSILLDYQFYGKDGGGYHITNLILHLAAAIILFIQLTQATGAVWRSAGVALLFALHPLHVESVAWVTERKDVLSGLFWMLATWRYLHYATRPNRRNYGWVMFFFICGLMAKPMLITLPLIFLLLDIWPAWRFGNSAAPLRHGFGHGFRSFTYALIEKVPFFVLIIIASAATFLTQQEGGAIGSLKAYSYAVRIENALVNYVVYLRQMVWPFDLAALYPHPGVLPPGQAIAAFGVLAVVTLLAIRFFFTYPFFLVGWLWYLITLLPVIGLVIIGPHSRADRYTYIPSIGIFIMVSWWLEAWVADRTTVNRRFMRAALPVFLALTALIAWLQTRYWADSATLFRHALAVTRNNTVAHNNYGMELAQKGEYQAARRELETALRITPGYDEAHTNIGNVFRELGDEEQARRHYCEAIRLNPRNDCAYNDLAVLLFNRNHPNLALALLTQALAVEPHAPDTRANLDTVAVRRAELAQSIIKIRNQIQNNPESADLEIVLGSLYLRAGALIKAKKSYARALALQPDAKAAEYGLSSVRWLKAERKEITAQLVRLNIDIGSPVDQYIAVANIYQQNGEEKQAAKWIGQAGRLP